MVCYGVVGAIKVRLERLDRVHKVFKDSVFVEECNGFNAFLL